jgi:hypothetical protein
VPEIFDEKLACGLGVSRTGFSALIFGRRKKKREQKTYGGRTSPENAREI